LRARLSDPGGVSLAALIELTGWQAHTLRAALSGLRKDGLTLTRRREGEDTIYAIEPAGPEASLPVEGVA
jgi:DNA-binding transcriptional regulator PaaX